MNAVGTGFLPESCDGRVQVKSRIGIVFTEYDKSGWRA